MQLQLHYVHIFINKILFMFIVPLMYTVKCGKTLMGLTMRHQYRQCISRSSKCFDSKKDKYFCQKDNVFSFIKFVIYYFKMNKSS